MAAGIDLPAADDPSLSWRERASVLVQGLGAAAGRMLQRAMLAAENNHARNAKDFMVAAAIASEKAALLGGGATSRTESYSVSARVDPEAERERIRQYDEEIALLNEELRRLEGGDPVGVLEPKAGDGDGA